MPGDCAHGKRPIRRGREVLPKDCRTEPEKGLDLQQYRLDPGRRPGPQVPRPPAHRGTGPASRRAGAEGWEPLEHTRHGAVRAGDWAAAVVALDKSCEVWQGGDIFDWLFLAMAHWQLGEKEEARKWFDQAVEWIDKNKPQDDDIKRFRAEAAELLGVKEN